MTFPAQQNLITNPSFESGAATGWTTTKNGLTSTDAVVSTSAWAGTHAFEHNVTANTTAGWWAKDAMSIPGLIAGLTYAFGAHYYSDQANLDAVLIIEWYTAGAALISTTTSPAGNVNNAWTPLELDDIAPATATNAKVYLQALSAGSGTGHVRFDAIDFRQSDRLDTYIDGSMPYCSWNGAANLSTSTRAAVAEQKAVGWGGLVAMSTVMYRADQYNNQSDALTAYVSGGDVTMSIDATIISTLSCVLVDPTQVVPNADFLAPIQTLTYADGSSVTQQVGLYVTQPAKRTFAEGFYTADIKGYDLTWVVSRSTIQDTLVVRKGSEPISEAQAVLTAGGFTRFSIPKSAKTLANDLSWPPGTDRLTIVNKLMGAASYYVIWADRTGVLTSRPYDDTENVASAVTFDSTVRDCHVLDAVVYDPTTDPVVNQVTVVWDHPTGAPTAFTMTNNNPASPSSTVNLGSPSNPLIYNYTYKDSTFADVAAMQAAVKKTLQEKTSLYTKADLTTLPDVSRAPHEYYALNLVNLVNGRAITGQWAVRGWTLMLTPSKTPMVHHLSKLETIVAVS